MIRLAIDIGSFTTKIYIPGSGVVLDEATCVAVEDLGDGTGRYKALGDRARALVGKAAQNTHIINPVKEGEIAHPDMLTDLLEYFLEKIEIPLRKARHCEAIFVLPCGAGDELKQSYLDVAYGCGIGRVYFTQTPFAAVLGHNATLSETFPVFSLDIGYGMTNIGVVSLDGIINGLSVNLGGGNIDVDIIDYMAENFRLKIGTLTAERIKNTVGSLLEDDNKMTIAEGRSLDDGTPASVAVNSSYTEGIIKLYIDKILEYVTLVMSKLPAEVASAVMHGGIYLSGGLTKLDGLGGYISRSLGIPVDESEAPGLCSVMGGGPILACNDLRAALAEGE